MFTEYCNIKPDETILEIGPGVGNLTESLLDKARYLICIEKNPKYIPVLHERFKHSSKLKIIQEDALKAYLPIHDRLVSNLPYKITEAFFQRTLRLKFKTATFIVPKRFSKTLIAKQSEQEYSKLSWLSQLFYNSTQHENVSPKAYLPEPKIQTTIITLKPKKDITEVEKTLKELVRQGDKYTKNALREALIKSEICSTKRKARKYINDLNIEQRTLQSRASRLSLHDLQTIEEKITGEPYIQSA